MAQLSWRNPHFGAVLLVENADGTQEEWGVEADAVNSLLRRGLTRDQLEVGTRVRFGGYSAISGQPKLLATNMLLTSGKEWVMGAVDRPLRWTDPVISDPDIKAEELDTGIFRVWSFGSFYRRKEPFELTEKAELAVASFDPFTDLPALNCVAPGMPNAILNPYPIEFIYENENIRLKIEEWEAERMIDMVATEIPNDAPRSRLGYSIGRISGNILEVRTGRLNSPMLDDDGIPMSQDAEIVERFTVSPDDNSLNYEVTVTDPEYLLKSATWVASWKWQPGTVIRPFECDL